MTIAFEHFCHSVQMLARHPQRIVTLLPSATEIVCGIGLRDRLDSNAWFSRPGPRLVDGLEHLARILARALERVA